MPKENRRMQQGAEPFPWQVFRLFVYNYERWLFYALELDKRTKDELLQMTEENFLYPLDDCILYVKKHGDFKDLTRRLITIYLPFRSGLWDTFTASLWDETDAYMDMTITSMETDGEDFTVYYTHPTGELMRVDGKDLGFDELVNILSSFIHRDGNEMKSMTRTPEPGRQTVCDFASPEVAEPVSGGWLPDYVSGQSTTDESVSLEDFLNDYDTAPGLLPDVSLLLGNHLDVQMVNL